MEISDAYPLPRVPPWPTVLVWINCNMLCSVSNVEGIANKDGGHPIRQSDFQGYGRVYLADELLEKVAFGY